MKLAKFKQSLVKAETGSTIDMGDGLKVTVARIGCKAYQDVIKKLTAPHQRAIRNKTLDDSVYETIMNKALAETILLGWEGLEDEHGEVIKYSKEKAYELLTDPEYKDFKDAISDLANEQEVFRQAEVETTATKSQ